MRIEGAAGNARTRATWTHRPKGWQLTVEQPRDAPSASARGEGAGSTPAQPTSPAKGHAKTRARTQAARRGANRHPLGSRAGGARHHPTPPKRGTKSYGQKKRKRGVMR